MIGGVLCSYRIVTGIGLAWLVGIAACYSPELRHCELTCTAETGCPDGFSCSMPQGRCRKDGVTAPCAPPPIDAPVDAPVDASGFCYGTPTGLFRPCFSTRPVGPISLSGAIDTSDNGSNILCSTTVSTSAACVIAAETIMITGPVTVTGSRPLVLVGTTSISIGARIDAASHRSTTAPYPPTQVGPASGGCSAGVLPIIAGGGAGGSFGSMGGRGGLGFGANAVGGVPAQPMPITTVTGGCSGQPGLSGGSGRGGNGGGAVYLISSGAIMLTSTGLINASGEGGARGAPIDGSGGGGGSGGMIVLDAPMITNAGMVWANGGGGGGGAANNLAGQPGNDPIAVTTGAPGGGAAASTAGSGGNGGAVAAPTNGGDVSGAAGAGGGGGGQGVIRVFGGGTLTGSVSPAPS